MVSSACMSGTFAIVITQNDVDFYVKCYGGDWAKDLLGAKTTMKIKECDDGRWAFCVNVDKMPAMNSFDIMREGVEQCCDTPLFGGKAKVKFCVNREKKEVNTEVDSEKWGKWTMREQYCEEGMKLTNTKDGMAHVENYSRVVKEEGFYKYNRDENVCKVMSVAGAPEEMIKSLKNYKMAWRTDKDCFQMVEWFGKTKVVTKSKLGEEVEVPEAAHNNLTTRTGPGKYKMFINMKNGTKEEWNLHFRDSGLDICGKNLKTGDSCKLYLDRFNEPCGTWKPVSIIGCEDGLTQMGMPQHLIDGFANEYDLRIHISEDSPMICYNWESKLSPLKMTFKYGEEFEVYDPALKENCQCVITRNGNKLHMVCKYPKYTFCTEVTIGDHFMVYDTTVKGTSINMQYILERECC